MKFLLFSIVLLATRAIANPIATAHAVKSWERCVVAIDREQAHVSCAIGYKIMALPKEFLFIEVPVWVPASTPKEDLPRLIGAKIEFEGGAVHTPSRYDEADHVSAPSGTRVVHAVFRFDQPPANAFAIVASYRQPVHQGKFHYIPQFEDGERRRDPETYNFTAFPLTDTTLHLVEPRTPSSRSLATRIALTPEHRKTITIEVK